MRSSNRGIEFIFVPPYLSTLDLQGRVRNVDPDSYMVAVYIFVEGAGWWTKPTFESPLTPIDPDSTWICNITTGENDIYATRIHAFLLPDGLDPPLADGLACLPASLDTLSVANVDTARIPRVITFSGHEWWIKASALPVGPGPNCFSDSTESVWVDQNDRLHLSVRQRSGVWYCSEVILDRSLGYGTYTFRVIGQVGLLDPSVVLGFFTWDSDGCDVHFREMDIEFSRWANQAALNAQYVVQPWDSPGNRYRWMIDESVDQSTHQFEWQQDRITFCSWKGHSGTPPSPDSLIQSWEYTGPDIPSHGNERIRINMWLFEGNPPTDGQDVEVMISDFRGPEVGVRPSVMPDSRHSLLETYPNPFIRGTTIRYLAPATGDVAVSILDVAGRTVRSLVNRKMNSGWHTVVWDGLNDLRERVSPGVYICTMRAEAFFDRTKIVLLE